jgi:hypothetical protein
VTADWVLCPEELALVDEYLADRWDPTRPTSVYVLHLGSGAAYVGLAYNPADRFKGHARNAKKTPTPRTDGIGPIATQFENPSTAFLALNGDPNIVAVIPCATRRHAFLVEAELTARLAAAGVHVFGNNYDQTGETRPDGDAPATTGMWARNEAKGSPVEATALAALAS